MHTPAQLAAATLAGPLRLGPLRLSAFGLCSAAGLIAAFTLMRRTAAPAGLDPEPLADAGLFAAMAAFVLSRLLLIATDPHAFLTYPLLILGLPSLTYGGMALTAFATCIYLRRKHLPLLAVLDASSPSAAVLAAALALGHFLEATDPGMPSTLPWAVHMPGWHLRMQPVQLYAMLAALILAALLLIQLSRPHAAGAILRTALIAGGLTAYALQMLTQPDPFAPEALLEPGQWIALAALMAGLVLAVILYRSEGRPAPGDAPKRHPKAQPPVTPPTPTQPPPHRRPPNRHPTDAHPTVTPPTPTQPPPHRRPPNRRPTDAHPTATPPAPAQPPPNRRPPNRHPTDAHPTATPPKPSHPPPPPTPRHPTDAHPTVISTGAQRSGEIPAFRPAQASVPRATASSPQDSVAVAQEAENTYTPCISPAICENDLSG